MQSEKGCPLDLGVLAVMLLLGMVQLCRRECSRAELQGEENSVRSGFEPFPRGSSDVQELRNRLEVDF